MKFLSFGLDEEKQMNPKIYTSIILNKNLKQVIFRTQMIELSSENKIKLRNTL